MNYFQLYITSVKENGFFYDFMEMGSVFYWISYLFFGYN